MKLSFFHYWQSYQQKVLNFIVLQFSQHITHLTAKFFHFHGGPLIFENVNMTHQLEIWHSEESERIWASFRRFGTHYLLIKWAQRYYDDTIKIYMASTNSSSNLKLIFLIMSTIEAELLSQRCLSESQQWLSLFFTFDFVWSISFFGGWTNFEFLLWSYKDIVI